MTLLQFAIGTVNDLVDAPRDAGRKPGKPIPAGLVTVRGARVIAVGSAVAGLVLAVVGGPWLVALAAVVLAIGLAYDLWAKGTTLSWLPFALGIPLLPVYGWYGATGSLPGAVPRARPGRRERRRRARDRQRPRRRRARRGGRRCARSRSRSARPGAGWLVVVLNAVVARAGARHGGRPRGADGLGGRDPARRASRRWPAPCWGSWRPAGAGDRRWRELAWEIQAVGTGLLAVAWLGALSASTGTTPAPERRRPGPAASPSGGASVRTPGPGSGDRRYA